MDLISNFEIIIIRGAPGIGKSTLGEMLRASDKFPAVIDVDIIRNMIHGEKFKYGVNDHYINSISATWRLVELLLSNHIKPVVVVDVFSKIILSLFLKALCEKQIVVVNLISSNEILVKRMSNRSKGYIDLNVASKLNQHIKTSAMQSDITLDTTNLSPRRMMAKFLSLLNMAT
jgi:broad-specificity NMP kinase